MKCIVAFSLLSVSFAFAGTPAQKRGPFPIPPSDHQNPNLFDNPDHLPGQPMPMDGAWPTGHWQPVHPVTSSQPAGAAAHTGHMEAGKIPTAVPGIAPTNTMIGLNKPTTTTISWVENSDNNHRQPTGLPEKILPTITTTTHPAEFTTHQPAPTILPGQPAVDREHVPTDVDVTTIVKTVTTVKTTFLTTTSKSKSTTTETKTETKIHTNIRTVVVPAKAEAEHTSLIPVTFPVHPTQLEHEHPHPTIPVLTFPAYTNCTTTLPVHPAFFECVSTIYKSTATATVDCKGCKGVEVETAVWMDKHKCETTNIKSVTLPATTCTVCKAGTDKTMAPVMPAGTGVPTGPVVVHEPVPTSLL